jgi:hypothetical protein
MSADTDTAFSYLRRQQLMRSETYSLSATKFDAKAKCCLCHWEQISPRQTGSPLEINDKEEAVSLDVASSPLI